MLPLASADEYDDLGADDWKLRNKATQLIKGDLTPAREKKLLELLKSKDTEVVQRASVLLRPYFARKRKERVDKIIADCRGKLPWCDMGEGMMPYLNAVPWTGQDGPPTWKRYSDATELFLCQNGDLDLEGIIESMKERQRQWVEQYGKNYNPPITLPWK